jgi:m7GpppX diphosphatase
VSIIYPATEKHILKYSELKFQIIQETSEIYKNVVLPYIETQRQFSIDWVYNILEHKSEVDKIIYEDLDPTNGFILLPDYKWNGQKETMYLLAIVMDRKIKSLRDLNEDHLPLLENIRTNSLIAIREKFQIEEHEVRAYFHYQPSFYHLHCHFTFLGYDAPGIHCARAHLLDNVIENIKLVNDYYQRASLTFSTFEKDKILAEIKKYKNSLQ